MCVARSCLPSSSGGGGGEADDTQHKHSAKWPPSPRNGDKEEGVENEAEE